MNRLLIITLLLLFATPSCNTLKRLDYSKGMDLNVCKEFKGNILLYTVFVDTKTTSPWTEFDIKTTLDSINIAINWLQSKAKENNIPINIISDYYIGPEYTTIRKNLPYPTIRESVTEPNHSKGMQAINKWADFISRKAGDIYPLPNDEGIREIRKPKNKERLIALLRDKFDVESVALLIMVNNYYKDDISVPINSLHTKDVEFGIVSYKYPSDIAHNILHLFGATDLYETIYRKNDRNIEFAQEHFPNDIMQDPYAKKIQNLSIDEFTKYMIGWDNELSEEYHQLLLDKVMISKE